MQYWIETLKSVASNAWAFTQTNPGTVVSIVGILVAIVIAWHRHRVQEKHRREDRDRVEQHERKEREREQERAKLQAKKELEEARKSRIVHVTEEYMAAATSHPPYDSHITGLIRAGITTLKTEEEAREAIEILAERAPKHPIPRNLQDALLSPSVDVLCVFRKWKEIGYGRSNPPKQFHEVIEMCKSHAKAEDLE